MSFLRMQHMERWKTIFSLGGKNTPDISHDALCSHYHKIQSLPINFRRRHEENVSVTRGTLLIFISTSGCQFWLRGAHPEDVVGWSKASCLVQPPPAGRVRGVPLTEIEWLQFRKRASDSHPSAPPRLTFASSGPLFSALFCIPLESSCKEFLFRVSHVLLTSLCLEERTPSLLEAGIKQYKWFLWKQESNLPSVAPSAKGSGWIKSMLHIFKENAYLNQIFDEFNFPLWASSGIIISFMWKKVHWLR